MMGPHFYFYLNYVSSSGTCSWARQPLWFRRQQKQWELTTRTWLDLFFWQKIHFPFKSFFPLSFPHPSYFSLLSPPPFFLKGTEGRRTALTSRKKEIAFFFFFRWTDWLNSPQAKIKRFVLYLGLKVESEVCACPVCFHETCWTLSP